MSLCILKGEMIVLEIGGIPVRLRSRLGFIQKVAKFGPHIPLPLRLQKHHMDGPT